MKHTFSMYHRLLSVQMRSQMQYRVSFWLDMAGTAVITLFEFASLALVFKRRIVQGCPLLVKRIRQATQNVPGVINTAYIERLNASFRLRLCWLTRRTRTLAKQPETLTAGLFISGAFTIYVIHITVCV